MNLHMDVPHSAVNVVKNLFELFRCRLDRLVQATVDLELVDALHRRSARICPAFGISEMVDLGNRAK